MTKEQIIFSKINSAGQSIRNPLELDFVQSSIKARAMQIVDPNQSGIADLSEHTLRDDVGDAWFNRHGGELPETLAAFVDGLVSELQAAE